MNENEIIDEVLEGRRESYALLVRQHQSKVYHLCLSLLRNERDAEEAAQDSFIKAFSALSSFRKDSAFSTWIYRISFRHCQDQIRKQARQKSESLEALLESNNDKIQSLFSSPLNTQDLEENHDLIERLLNSIKPDYREILILREVNGFSYQEMAVFLGVTEESVKMKLHRARTDIREKMRNVLSKENV